MRSLAIALALAVSLTAAPVTQAREGNRAGEFDYYALVLSWSPAYCEGRGRDDGGAQCNGGRPFAFVLHGLWPQYERGWPQNCRTAERPWVPQPLIDSMLDIMPSPRLVIHEYRKHGTCSGLTPQAYYGLSRRLYNRINIPDRYRDLRDALTLAPHEVEADFLKANPGLKPEMVSIVCSYGRLSELRICFNRDESLRACGSNENQAKLCPAGRITLPPVRARH